MAIDRRVSTQDLSWFLDLYRNGQLDLNPPYQRRSVWSPKDRRYFLDTIFRGFPSPSIFLHKKIIKGKTIYSVVDGKQRLETIIRFSEDNISIDKRYGDIRLDGMKWKTIGKNKELARTFWDYVIPVEFINIPEDTTLVNEVFDRLNRNSRKLVDQELRHAKYEGWFISFVEREAESSDWEELGIVTTARAKRMRDVQFLSELLMITISGSVVGFDQELINQYYAKFDDLDDLEEQFNEEQAKNLFDNAKKYMVDLEHAGDVILKFATDFNNFYTLWALISINFEGLPELSDFIQVYSKFMDQVNKYRNEEYFAKVISKGEEPITKESLNYFLNSRGASTEQPQRQERYKILKSVIFG